jgi:photosystem II stability/assembly factor-like uncharacterized protein
MPKWNKSNVRVEVICQLVQTVVLLAGIHVAGCDMWEPGNIVPPDYGRLPEIGIIEDVCFVDQMNLWIIFDPLTGKPLLYHSSDRGTHWFLKSTPFPIPLRNIFFADAQRGWIGADSSVLFNTTNGGRGWDSYKFIGGGRFVGKPRFITPSEGWVTVSGPRGMRGLGQVYHTMDGGTSWQCVFTNDPYTLASLDALGDTIIAVGGEFIDPLGPAFAVTSVDRGKTWRTNVDQSSATLYEVSLFAGGRAYCTSGGGLYRSTDLGGNWIALNTIDGGSGDFVVTEQLILAGVTRDRSAGNPTCILYSTSDRGDAWQVLWTSPSDSQYYVLREGSFLGEPIGCIAGCIYTAPSDNRPKPFVITNNPDNNWHICYQ